MPFKALRYYYVFTLKYLHKKSPNIAAEELYLCIEITQTWIGGFCLTVRLQRNLLTFPCLFNSIMCFSAPQEINGTWRIISSILFHCSLLFNKVHSDQFWKKRDIFVIVVQSLFFFFKVIVQYKIHTTICNFGDSQKKRVWSSVFLCKHINKVHPSSWGPEKKSIIDKKLATISAVNLI